MPVPSSHYRLCSLSIQETAKVLTRASLMMGRSTYTDRYTDGRKSIDLSDRNELPSNHGLGMLDVVSAFTTAQLGILLLPGI